jgi:hypothetical protein
MGQAIVSLVYPATIGIAGSAFVHMAYGPGFGGSELIMFVLVLLIALAMSPTVLPRIQQQIAPTYGSLVPQKTLRQQAAIFLPLIILISVSAALISSRAQDLELQRQAKALSTQIFQFQLDAAKNAPPKIPNPATWNSDIQNQLRYEDIQLKQYNLIFAGRVSAICGELQDRGLLLTQPPLFG